MTSAVADDLPAPVAVHRGAHRRRSAGLGKVVKETLFYIAVVIVVLIALFPFYWVLRTSLLSNQQVSAGVGGANGIIPSHLSGVAYSNVFTQGSFLRPLINSFIVALATTVVTVIVASMAGYALARLRIRGTGAILGFIGLVHGAKVGWDIGPQIALGYLFAAVILAGFGFLTRGQSVEPASDDDVEAAIEEGTPVDGGDPVASTDGVPGEVAAAAEAPAAPTAAGAAAAPATAETAPSS